MNSNFAGLLDADFKIPKKNKKMDDKIEEILDSVKATTNDEEKIEDDEPPKEINSLQSAQIENKECALVKTEKMDASNCEVQLLF